MPRRCVIKFIYVRAAYIGLNVGVALKYFNNKTNCFVCEIVKAALSWSSTHLLGVEHIFWLYIELVLLIPRDVYA